MERATYQVVKQRILLSIRFTPFPSHHFLVYPMLLLHVFRFFPEGRRRRRLVPYRRRGHERCCVTRVRSGKRCWEWIAGRGRSCLCWMSDRSRQMSRWIVVLLLMLVHAIRWSIDPVPLLCPPTLYSHLQPRPYLRRRIAFCLSILIVIEVVLIIGVQGRGNATMRRIWQAKMLVLLLLPPFEENIKGRRKI